MEIEDMDEIREKIENRILNIGIVTVVGIGALCIGLIMLRYPSLI